ncbi:FAD-dependent oxidoreductase [Aeromicrobium sp. CTD01-1L150]|uniref:FAD-dependent oxidoreductase n=1 Tax=Aeromicrobium sp. CTD01-1L150 TaxID=3341830 RepID=UPI0035C062B1
MTKDIVTSDVVVVGGGLGAVAAALACLRQGHTAVLASPHHILGGQLTAQGVPLDEHPWAEAIGSASYRSMREGIRAYYRRNYPLTHQAANDARLNPGLGNISTLTHEPSVAAAVIEELLAPWASAGRLRVLRSVSLVGADVDGAQLRSVHVRAGTGMELELNAPMFVDASELGDLLPLAGVEYVIGGEGRDDTGELNALEVADPYEQQAATWCFAVDYRPGENHTIAEPAGFRRWRTIQIPDWPGPQFSWTVSDHVTHEPRDRKLFAGPPGPEWRWDLWHARRIFSRFTFQDGFADSDVTLANWPQMDYWAKPLLGVGAADHQQALQECKDLSRSFLYWMQTQAPRLDGGQGYPELRLRGDVLGTNDGFALEPYYRESRRIVPELRVLEQHIGVAAREGARGAETFDDTVGVGAYRIDIHPSTRERNTVDIDTFPYQIPLGALICASADNLLAGAKNIGTTRVTNGAYRVHTTEWSVGEAAGHVAGYCVENGTVPSAVRATPQHLASVQDALVRDGVDLAWPEFGALVPTSRPGWRRAE